MLPAAATPVRVAVSAIWSGSPAQKGRAGMMGLLKAAGGSTGRCGLRAATCHADWNCLVWVGAGSLLQTKRWSVRRDKCFVLNRKEDDPGLSSSPRSALCIMVFP